MFIVKEVYIKGFIRLGNVGVNELYYTPNERLQFIIGSNGSGKSTLIKMLVPHVPKYTTFTNEGEYKLVVELDGVIYTLHYVLSPKPRSSFTINNGKELNDGGTGAVQKKLIEHYIKLDQDVINIILGVECFTTMSPARRKYWMGRLSPTNVDFIISAYTKVNEKLRSANSNIQFLQRKILTTNETLQGLGDDTDIRTKHDYYTECLDKLYPLKFKASTVQPLSLLADEVNRISTDYLTSVTKIKPTLIINGIELTINDRERIVDTLQWATNQYEISKQAYISKVDELTHLEEHTTIIECLGSEDELRTQLESRKVQRTTLVGAFELAYPNTLDQFDTKVLGTESALAALTTNDGELIGAISGACHRIPVDPDSIYSRESYNKKQQYLTNLLSDRALLTSEIAQARNIIIGCNSAEHVHCKRCNNKWIPGYDEGEVKRAEQVVLDKTEHLENVLVFIELAQDWLATYDNWLAQYNILTGILGTHPELSDIMAIILSPNIIRANPKSAHLLINEYTTKLKQVVEIHQLTATISEIESQLEQLIESKKYGYDNLLKRHDIVNEARIVANNDRIEYQSNINTLKAFLVTSDIYTKQTELLNSVTAKVGQHGDAYREQLESEMIDSLIRELQVALGKSAEEISKRDSLLKTIADLESNLIEERTLLSQYQMLSEGLNPTVGILAEQLSVSINAIVDGINAVIGRIWKTDLYIQPCGIEEGELNYKFPFNMDDCNDVSEGSSGQQEIVNLAFKIMVYHLLNLHQFPLFLDETGALFDRSHKIMLTRYIADCLENGVFSQVFYISHAVEQYASAGASDVNVLCEKNVALPAIYNTHLKLS